MSRPSTAIVRRGFRIRHFPGVTSVALAFFAFLYLPIIILLALSFNQNSTVTVWTGFTLDWYNVVLGSPDIVRAAKSSLFIATVAALSATVISTIAALAMDRARFRGHGAVNAVIALPLIVPEIVTAVATLLFFASLGLQLGHFTVILAHSVFCIPFAYLPIRARLTDMDPQLAEAAADLYANAWLTFRRVIFPLLLPGILSGLALAFIISLDDFVITFFVSGAGSTTLPVYIYGMVRIGITPEVNAVSSFMILISVIFVSLSYILARQRR